MADAPIFSHPMIDETPGELKPLPLMPVTAFPCLCERDRNFARLAAKCLREDWNWSTVAMRPCLANEDIRENMVRPREDLHYNLVVTYGKRYVAGTLDRQIIERATREAASLPVPPVNGPASYTDQELLSRGLVRYGDWENFRRVSYSVSPGTPNPFRSPEDIRDSLAASRHAVGGLDFSI